MSAILNEINNDIIDLEERLLAEFQRLRELEPSDTYSSIESSINDQISLNLSTHLQALEHSGDRDNLSLRTEEHEQLDERMLVVKNLLNRRIPNAFLEVSHQEVKQSRRALELLVIRARTAAGRKTEKSTTSAAARNRINITPEEERRYSGENLYLDNGVFSASRELSILNHQVAQHHEEDQSIEEVIKARSKLKSRELTKGHAETKKPRNIAQSPDEIRQKLDGQSSADGEYSFTAKNLSHSAPARDKRDIAQSPEAIRKKLESRPAKPIDPAKAESLDAKPFVELTLTDMETEEPKPTGKAQFGPRDISEPKP